jgi:hypothetical protein
MKLKKKELEDLKQGSRTVSEYVTQFTQLSRYAPDNEDIDEKKQDWFLNVLNNCLAYALEARDFINFQNKVGKALVLENEEESWSGKGRFDALDLRGATRGFVLVLPRRDLISAQVSRLDSAECKLWVKDIKLPSNRFNAPTSRLLALDHRHHKETVLHKILVLWDCATVVHKAKRT